ncbi:uncharacterized protein MONBRDRAFT_32180 [Monosiga brevicollis MX1]|uniref:BAR domain-containing protein n=1 Tax=Monosiga brevicollis TaxID=81824 RepID=A9UY54_MONBE|nr:uncharacterized protein MONBRDRAFT_32180 [Monosiga brevicollis MX1]EDQ89801.1 predicted protein [Monosiga brevicollis MX1]|eukprot:XP_001745223.1 hypothetical protein [Monosiga brevicollis MX1]
MAMPEGIPAMTRTGLSQSRVEAPPATPLDLGLRDTLFLPPPARAHLRAFNGRFMQLKSSMLRAEQAMNTFIEGIEQACQGLQQMQECLQGHANSTAQMFTGADPEGWAQRGEARQQALLDGIDNLQNAHEHLRLLATTTRAAVMRDLSELQTQLQRDVIGIHAECIRAQNELCHALQRYGKLPQKKCTEKVRYDHNLDVYRAHKDHHHLLLDYVVQGNAVNQQLPVYFHRVLKQLLQLLNQHLRATGPMSSETADTPRTAHNGTPLTTNGERFQDLLFRLESACLDGALDGARMKEVQQAEAQALKAATDRDYFLDVDENDPFLEQERDSTPNTSATILQSYLFWRQPRRGRNVVGPARWDLVYAVCRNGQLELQDPISGQPQLQQSLFKCRATFEETDDRRFVLHVILPTPGKQQKRIVLQTQNTKMLRTWITVLGSNIQLARTIEQPNARGTAVVYRPELDLEQDEEDDEENSRLRHSLISEAVANWNSTDGVALSLTTQRGTPPNVSYVAAAAGGPGLDDLDDDDDDFEPDASMVDPSLDAPEAIAEGSASASASARASSAALPRRVNPF